MLPATDLALAGPVAQSSGPACFTAFIGLGANLGEPRQALESARRALAALPFTSVLASSPLYRSRPVDAQGPDFLNAVVALSCGLGPEELMRALLAIERAHHRERPHHHAPRTLDLDLLWLAGHAHDTPLLQLPHPRMAQRAFVLQPLADLLAAWPGPRSGALPAAPVLPGLPSHAQRRALARAQGLEALGPW